MKTFRQFQEEWNRGNPINPKNPRRSSSLHHNADIEGHNVKTIITHKAPGKVGVDFAVNGSYDRNNPAGTGPNPHVDPKTGNKILKHVRGVVKHYVDRHNLPGRKPVKEVDMIGNTERKTRVYNRFAEKPKAFGDAAINIGKTTAKKS